MSSKRIHWIDQVKGFAIICMIISHAIPGYLVHLKNWITAFNMPLFFFVSGVLSRQGKDYSKQDLKEYLSRKFYTIGVPYYVFSLIYCLFIALLSVAAGESFRSILSSFLSRIINTVLMLGIQSMWFLPVYFISMLIYDFALKKQNSLTLFIIIVLTGILLILTGRYDDPNQWIRLAGKTGCALIFIIAGHLSAAYLSKIKPIPALLGMALFSCSALYNGFVSMNFEFGKVSILFFVNAVMLSIIICGLFIRYGHSLTGKMDFLLCEFGKYSIAVLVTNNVIIEVLRLADHKLTGNWFLNHGLAGYLMFAVLILLCEIPVIKAAQGKFAFLFGKREII